MISGGSRIFPRGVRQLPKVLLFFNNNCMKKKEFWASGGARVPGGPLDPPMMMAHADVTETITLSSKKKKPT